MFKFLKGDDKPKIKECSICGKETDDSRQAKDGFLCDKCYNAAGFPASISVMQMPIALLKEQINSDDGLSIVKRFKARGGKEQITKTSRMFSSGSNNVPRCPKCGSTSMSANQKGFGIGKALIGTAVIGPIGMTAGNVGAKKVRITCLNCGYQWMAGKR